MPEAVTVGAQGNERAGEPRIGLDVLLARTPEVVSRRRSGDSGSDVVISSVEIDSRHVRPGSLFACVRGEHSDGHAFAAGAVAAGAVALVVDHEVEVAANVAQIVVGDTRTAVAYLAASFHDRPSRSLDVIGVTGTNGKTTTTHILASALEALGRPTGVIGTLSGAHTTPESVELQQRLAEFRDRGDVAVAMEVSSHALALDRVLGTRFRVGVFTNLGRDHLDLHETQERYFAAKAKLFDPSLTSEGVVNVDDVHGRLLLDTASIPITTYSVDDATDITVTAFEHDYVWRGQRLRVGLGGRFNVSNSLAAATTLAVLGFTPADIATGLAATGPVRGRFEPVDRGQDFTVVVDYAHTPDALELVLLAGRDVITEHGRGGQLIVVFGCGGDRDHSKRPDMGRIAAAGADLAVLTSDNPRTEEPLAIINDVIDGVPADYRGRIAVEPDRHDAIAIALRAAGPGDVVVIAGKGHETTQTFRSTVMPFDDRAVAQELLETMS
ncbi:MAG TPA: UDP-N-acetylmuramoyl-L-alanyl-D-glutamate--2,6-diaminopimelate ligase [Ilumatobacteraceae bacterium]